MAEHEQAVKLNSRIEASLKALRLADAAAAVREVRQHEGERVVLRALSYSADTESAGLLTYTLLSFLLNESEEALWHRAAARALSNELCHLPFAYDAALYHARRATEIEPDEPTHWQLILWVTSAPGVSDPDVKTRERRRAAEVLVKLDPENREAQLILGDT